MTDHREEAPSAWIQPQWPAPDNVKALITTRQAPAGDAVSCAPYDSFNLALHVQDDDAVVMAHRQYLQSQLQLEHGPQWLEQIHGTKVVEAQTDNLIRTADACYTQQPQLPCAVMTADCLPILLCDRQGTQVAAVHAGWRSLANGIVRNTLQTFAANTVDILAFMGPAIGQAHFEVGIDVLEGFYEGALSTAHCEAISAAFRPSLSRPMRFHANLYQLAQAELQELGVASISGGGSCTFDESERFYSYRRDGQTGRMASLIYLT